jgi:hypothetical protein
VSGQIVATPEIVPEKIVPVDMAMISLAIEKGAGIETIERLVALQEKLLDRQAEIEFNVALNRVQAEISRVAPDLTNPQTNSKYASYAALDAEIRPIYTKEGMSVSFTEEDCPKAEHVRIVAFVTKGAYTRKYRKDMPADGKGAKGGDVMTKTHAAGAADSYAKRYLIKDIFNIAVGEADRDGNDLMPENQEKDLLLGIEEAGTKQELETAYKTAIAAGLKAQDQGAVKLFMEARKKKQMKLEAA